MELAYSNSSAYNMKNPRAKVITITSGKGGVGKSSTATNLAISLLSLNKKVCVFDADASLANINILLGIQPKYTLQHLLNGEKTLKEIMIDGPRGLKVIPGATGIAQYTQLSDNQKTTLLAALDKLQQTFDYLIIDTAAGIGQDVLDFINASQFSIIIITPEPTSLTDSFSLLKVLKRSNYNRTSYVVVNMTREDDNGQSIYKRFKSAVKKYIHVDIAYLGHVQVDETMISSVSLQCPAVLLNPDSKASLCFKQLALTLEKNIKNTPSDSFSDFWRKQGASVEAEDLSISEAPINTFIGSPPIPIKKTLPSAPPLDFTRAAEFCLNTLSDGLLSNEEAARFIESILSHQVKEAHIEPAAEENKSSARDFYRYIEQSGFPKDIIREVVSTLEQVYFNQYGESISSSDATALKLFSQFNGSENELQQLHEQLSDCYQRHFDKPLYSPIEQLQTQTESSDFSNSAFDDALSQLLSTYQQRFNTHYKTQTDKELMLANEAIKALQERHKETLDELQRANVSLAERTSLLAKIRLLFPK